ncbi:MAG: cytochrome c [Nitrospinaceae bacterium]
MKPLKLNILITLFVLLTYACAPKATLEVPEAYKKGQQAFHKICSNCHGSDAMGKHTKAPKLIDVEYLANNFSDEDLRDTILNGTDKMPPQKKNVTSEEIAEIIKYLRYSQKTYGLEPEDDEEDEETPASQNK